MIATLSVMTSIHYSFQFLFLNFDAKINIWSIDNGTTMACQWINRHLNMDRSPDIRQPKADREKNISEKRHSKWHWKLHSSFYEWEMHLSSIDFSVLKCATNETRKKFKWKRATTTTASGRSTKSGSTKMHNGLGSRQNIEILSVGIDQKVNNILLNEHFYDLWTWMRQF